MTPKLRGVLFRHRARLPEAVADSALTLGEGNTPLVELQVVGATLGGGRKVFAKFEGANPTGSFKDRGMVVAVAAAAGDGAKCVVCASTGNTSASAAAYAARAGLACAVLIPAGKIAAGKIAQAVAHGANILQVDGDFDDAMHAVREMEESGDAVVVNSVNPMRIQGQKTAAIEVAEALGDAPDIHALPVGNAGNITAYWTGYREAAGLDANFPSVPGCAKTPMMLGCQASGAAPFVNGGPVAKAETVATAIRIGNPQSWDSATRAAKESGGRFVSVSDEQILAAQKLLAAREGLFCEPASAASVAGLLSEANNLPQNIVVVCTLTGHGLKDPDIVGKPTPQVFPADADSLKKALHKILSQAPKGSPKESPKGNPKKNLNGSPQ